MNIGCLRDAVQGAIKGAWLCRHWNDRLRSGVMLFGGLTIRMVWSFADITNAAMAIPNLVSLLALSGVIVAETRKYLWHGDIDGPTG